MSGAVVERRPDGWSAVRRAWEGQTAVIFCGGPSLTRDQVDACRGARAIAVNDAYLLAPWADAVYFADAKWHRWQKNGRDGKGMPHLGMTGDDVRAAFARFAGSKISISNSRAGIEDKNVHFLQNATETMKPGAIVSTDPGKIMTGSNSSFQAMNIAILAGASTVLMLGLDGRPASGGKKHWFGDHPDKSDAPYEAVRKSFMDAAGWCAANGVTLINCSPGTAVDGMKLGDLAASLRGEPPSDARPSGSVYVRASALLATGVMSRDALARAFPNEERELADALRKGIRKGTMVKEGGAWRKA